MLDTTTEAGASADRRLRGETMIWLATVRSDGQPQSVPVWFLWDGETFLVYSRPGQQKLKNIGSNAWAGLHLNANDRGGDVVRVEGTTALAEDVPPANQVGEYVEKYMREHHPHRLRPRRLRAGLLGRPPRDARALAGVVEGSR